MPYYNGRIMVGYIHATVIAFLWYNLTGKIRRNHGYDCYYPYVIEGTGGYS